MTEEWLIDELAHAGPEHLDPDFVARYDRKQGYPDPAQDIAEFEAHDLTSESTLIDFGAGTGRFAVAAAGRFRHVTAVDISPEMVRMTGERAAQVGVRNIDVVHAGFLSYRHAGEPFDGVFTRNALHHLPDFFKAIALARIHRLLRPGGILRLHDLIFDFNPADAGDAIARWFAAGQRDPDVGYTAADFAEHVRTEFSTYRWLFEPMLETAGFEILASEFVASVYGAYTCRSRAG